jgi:hypothetical protein
MWVEMLENAQQREQILNVTFTVTKTYARPNSLVQEQHITWWDLLRSE